MTLCDFCAILSGNEPWVSGTGEQKRVHLLSCNSVSISLLLLAMNDGALKVAANPECPQPFVCPLSKVRAGTAVRIKQLSAPPEVTHRLREMGFCEEQKIRLLSQQAESSSARFAMFAWASACNWPKRS